MLLPAAQSNKASSAMLRTADEALFVRHFLRANMGGCPKTWAAWFAAVLIAPLLVLLMAVVLLVLLPLLPIIVICLWFRGIWLKRRFKAVWGRRGKHILLVYSESPNWKTYIEANWLPRLAERTVILNWSKRHEWNHASPVEVKAFEHWSGSHDFNPLALYFPRRGSVKIIRFFRAFRDYKHGNVQRLRDAERKLFMFLDAAESRSA